MQKLYKHVPVFAQNLMVTAYGYKWRSRRFGGVFNEELKGYKEREQFTPEQWEGYQNGELKKLLLHAIEYVPFYRDKFAKQGLTKEAIQNFTVSDISKLPYLEKDELRKYGESSLLADNKSKGEFYSSSGSTGTPTKIFFSREMHQKWSAGFEARIRHWAGLTRFSPRGMIGGRRVLPEGISKGPYYRYNSAEKQVYFSAYHISGVTAPNYVYAIRKYKLEYMTGYAASNYFLANFINNLSIPAPKLKAVITSSEKLTPEMRDAFFKAYGCKTYDSWSGVEACGLISECEHGSLHMSPDMAIFEVLDNKGHPVKKGESGELVCTGLLNYDQPLIRYRIGDRIKLSEKNCACGRHMPVVEEIEGRVEDVIIGKDGRQMVRFHGIFINIMPIIRGQIIQEGIEHVIIKVAVSQPLSAGEKQLMIDRMVSQLGDIKVEVQEVDDIPLSANGKFRAVISKIKS